MELVRGLDLVGLTRRADVYHTARTILVTRQEQLSGFDRAFELFWGALSGRGRLQVSGTLPLPARPRVPNLAGPATLRQALTSLAAVSAPAGADHGPAEVLAALSYSPAERLRRKDFGSLSPEELAGVKRLMDELVLDLGVRRSRRWRRAGRYPVDIRNSIRRSLRSGGEILELSGRASKWKPRPLVVLADISGSMERYSGLLLHFIYGMAKSQAHPVEAFVFSTRLTHITPHLRNRDVERAVAGIARAVPDWSGGTRIGESLNRFNLHWARRVLGSGSVVLLISDGWDRGDLELLRREMVRLQRGCHRLIWLNPLLGSPLYEPLTMGIRAALPFVDDFLPIHNLASLEQLAAELDRLGPLRPYRRQQPAGFYGHSARPSTSSPGS
jgi:hypothetical protein